MFFLTLPPPGVTISHLLFQCLIQKGDDLPRVFFNDDVSEKLF